MTCELTAWMQLLALDGPARAWELKRLRFGLFCAAGRLIRGRRRLRLRIAATWPWAAQLAAAVSKLQAFAPG
jgi:Transposase DDE domain group 1